MFSKEGAAEEEDMYSNRSSYHTLKGVGLIKQQKIDKEAGRSAAD